MIISNYNLDLIGKEKFRQFQSRIVGFFKINFIEYDDDIIVNLVGNYNYSLLSKDYNIYTEQNIVKFLILELRTDGQFSKDELYSDYIQDIVNAREVGEVLDRILDDFLA